MGNYLTKIVKLGTRSDVVIPVEELERLGLKAGDSVYIHVERYDEEFPYTDEAIGPETRASIEDGLRDIREGRVGPEIRTKDELRGYLDRLKKQ